MKSNEVGTTLKHPETINGNVKNLSKRMKMKDKGECHFYITINITIAINYYPQLHTKTPYNSNLFLGF
jgi:hypothetical protein